MAQKKDQPTSLTDRIVKQDKLTQRVTELENEVSGLSDDLHAVRQRLAEFLAMNNPPPTKHCPKCGRAINRIDGKCAMGCRK